MEYDYEYDNYSGDYGLTLKESKRLNSMFTRNNMRDDRNKYDLTETKPERVLTTEEKKTPSLKVYNANLLDQYPNKFIPKSITIDSESLLMFLVLFLIVINLIIIKKIYFTDNYNQRIRFYGGGLDI